MLYGVSAAPAGAAATTIAPAATTATVRWRNARIACGFRVISWTLPCRCDARNSILCRAIHFASSIQWRSRAHQGADARRSHSRAIVSGQTPIVMGGEVIAIGDAPVEVAVLSCGAACLDNADPGHLAA